MYATNSRDGFPVVVNDLLHKRATEQKIIFGSEEESSRVLFRPNNQNCCRSTCGFYFFTVGLEGRLNVTALIGRECSN